MEDSRLPLFGPPGCPPPLFEHGWQGARPRAPAQVGELEGGRLQLEFAFALEEVRQAAMERLGPLEPVGPLPERLVGPQLADQGCLVRVEPFAPP